MTAGTTQQAGLPTRFRDVVVQQMYINRGERLAAASQLPIGTNRESETTSGNQIHSLWAEAVIAIRPELPSETKRLLEDNDYQTISRLLSERLKQCEDGKLKRKRLDGSTADVADDVHKIIVTVQTWTKVITTVASYDPSM